jgi:hypothetical protein
MDLGDLEIGERFERHHASLAVATAAGVLVFIIVAVFFHTWGQNFIVTTPFDGGNLSTEIGTDVEMNFYVRNTGQKPLRVDMQTVDLEFDRDWRFWSRDGFNSRDTTFVSANSSGDILEVESRNYQRINVKFTTPLDEGVFNLTLAGETSRGDFEKGVEVVVVNETAAN